MRSFYGRLFLPGLLPVLLALSGCLFASQPRPEEPQPRGLSPVERFMVVRTPGGPDSTGVVSDPEFGENLRIVLEQEFLSASGETCRRASLLSQNGESEVVIMCRDKTGEWRLAPRLWGQGLPPARKHPDGQTE